MIGSLVKFTIGYKDKAPVIGYGVILKKFETWRIGTGYPDRTTSVSILCGNETYFRPVRDVTFIKEEE